jgi:hypothetical protein
VLSIQAAQSVQVFQSIQNAHLVQVLPSKLRRSSQTPRSRSRIASPSDATAGEFATKYLAAGIGQPVMAAVFTHSAVAGQAFTGSSFHDSGCFGPSRFRFGPSTPAGPSRITQRYARLPTSIGLATF